jgi:hypothetical protein
MSDEKLKERKRNEIFYYKYLLTLKQRIFLFYFFQQKNNYPKAFAKNLPMYLEAVLA